MHLMPNDAAISLYILYCRILPWPLLCRIQNCHIYRSAQPCILFWADLPQKMPLVNIYPGWMVDAQSRGM